MSPLLTIDLCDNEEVVSEDVLTKFRATVNETKIVELDCSCRITSSIGAAIPNTTR